MTIEDVVQKSTHKIKKFDDLIDDCVFLMQPVTEDVTRDYQRISCLRLEPPQPPLMEIDDNSLKSRKLQKHFLDDKNQIDSFCLFHPNYQKSYFTHSISTKIEPPQSAPIDLEDKISQTCVLPRKYFAADNLTEHLITETFLPSGADTKYFDQLGKFLLESPQHPTLELEDRFSRQSATIKHICSNLSKPLVTHLHPPLIDFKETTCFYFRLDPPQAPPSEIDDTPLKTQSKIRNICEPVKDSDFVIMLWPLMLETEYESCSSSLLKLEPPQPPLHDLEDNIKNSEFKMKTLSELNLQTVILKIEPRILDSLECLSSDAFLFRMEPPQPPLIEIEDFTNRVFQISKALSEWSESISDPIVNIPWITTEVHQKYHTCETTKPSENDHEIHSGMNAVRNLVKF